MTKKKKAPKKYYGGRMAQEEKPAEGEIEYIENKIPPSRIDRVYHKSSESMGEIPDSSIHLMITSPPYNVRMSYEEDLSLEEWRGLMQRVFQETHNKLVTGGRACVNVSSLGRKPTIPLHRYIMEDMQAIGYLLRGEIIWSKGRGYASASDTAWGSWMSASNPVLRDAHEYIMVFSKDTFQRDGVGRQSTIQRQDFLEWTRSVWQFPIVHSKTVGHPAPFPRDLPYRLIQLYSFKGDVVLDPFCGSGTTCLVAKSCDRHYIGYDVVEKYVQMAQQRLSRRTLLEGIDEPKRKTKRKRTQTPTS